MIMNILIMKESIIIKVTLKERANFLRIEICSFSSYIFISYFLQLGI